MLHNKNTELYRKDTCNNVLSIYLIFIAENILTIPSTRSLQICVDVATSNLGPA